MDIKMPIKFHGNYTLKIRNAEKESRERCQKLTIRTLSEEEKELAIEGKDPSALPTHQITFYDFGCKRLINGTLKENETERVIFQVEDKEYEFSTFRPSR